MTIPIPRFSMPEQRLLMLLVPAYKISKELLGLLPIAKQSGTHYNGLFASERSGEKPS